MAQREKMLDPGPPSAAAMEARLAVFRYDEPVPPLPNHRTHREWETPKEEDKA